MPGSSTQFSATPMGFTTYYAGFWLRAVAYACDGIIILSVLYSMFTLLIFIADPQHFGQNLPDDQSRVLPMWVMLVFAPLCLFVPLLYFALMESSSKQATVGKMAVGIKVTDLQGRPLTFSHALLRNVAKIGTNFTCFFFCFGYIMAGLTQKKQSLHDIIANTLVLDKSAIQSPPFIEI